ncbi:MAG: hypothetical protein IKB05_04990 [Alphaproteobacteria bacterium]|nr:hypothetical protein [Alphaproteobacteria bacterium]
MRQINSLWVMLYGDKLMQEIAKYDVSASTMSIECNGHKQTNTVVYGICKNGFALYTTHIVDTSNPLKNIDTYVAQMVNHNKNIKLPKFKVISGDKFAKQIFEFMQNRHQNPVNLEMKQNVR